MTDQEMAAALEGTGEYRVLRRIFGTPISEIEGPHIGVALDVETTGLDHAKDEVIEIAAIPFAFDAEGRIIGVGEPFQSLRQPSRPIPSEIIAITGIDDAMVAGHLVDANALSALVGRAVIIIAHHAGFDRPFAERLCPEFEEKCWACSMSEIDWRAEGLESSRLSSLLMEAGWFYDRHRALADVGALVHLLSLELPRSRKLALAALLEAARQPTWRIWAEGAPFATKDTLKARGYRWSDGSSGRRKSWYFDASPERRDDEIAFLRQSIFHRRVDLPVDRLTAYTRFREAEA